MKRIAWSLVPLIVLVFAPFAPAKRAAPPHPVQRALQSEIIVTGKVTAIEKEPVVIEENGQKTNYAVAVIKVESALAGATNLTHVKVGVPAPVGAPGRGRAPVLTLEENQEGLFFLSKDPSGKFYSFNWMTGPVLASDGNFKETVASVKRALTAIADPMKALNAAKTEDRSFAAIALAMKYRHQPQTNIEIGTEKIAAEESQLILKGIAEADWVKFDPSLPPPASAFYMLGLTAEDGWAAPKAGVPGQNYNETLRTAFAKWIEGPGKDYRINKFVVKK